MLLSRAWRGLVVAALLLAQQSALAHQLWHIASPTPAAAAFVDDAAPGHPLCDQHGALDAVLGALHTANLLPALEEQAAASVLPASAPAASLEALSASSRGPPASL